jgi:hypothetical protein
VRPAAGPSPPTSGRSAAVAPHLAASEHGHRGQTLLLGIRAHHSLESLLSDWREPDTNSAISHRSAKFNFCLIFAYAGRHPACPPLTTASTEAACGGDAKVHVAAS